MPVEDVALLQLLAPMDSHLLSPAVCEASKAIKGMIRVTYWDPRRGLTSILPPGKT